MAINFISSKDSEETGTMHTKSYNTEIMMGNELNEIIKELFKSLLQNYQNDLEISMRGSESMKESAELLYNHLQNVSLRRGGSYVDSPKWLKQATTNLKNNADKCFQYALTVTLNYQNIKKFPQS